MKTASDWLDAVKVAHSLPSDYALAKLMGVEQNVITSIRKGRRQMSEPQCFAIAELLDENGVAVLASVKASKTDIPKMRKDWLEVAEKLAVNG